MTFCFRNTCMKLNKLLAVNSRHHKIKAISLEDKYYAIFEIERKQYTKKQITTKLEVSKSSVLKWFATETLKLMLIKAQLGTPISEEVDLSLYDWFK